MDFEYFVVLPEATRTEDLVDDEVFTVVSDDGEVYTSYRIIRITHRGVNQPDGWTHVANVSAMRQIAMGVAMLEVVNREIVRAQVTIPEAT